MPIEFLTQHNLRKIAEAHDISDDIKSLQNKLDSILEPIAKLATSLSDEELTLLIKILPDGFYKTELQTFLHEKK